MNTKKILTLLTAVIALALTATAAYAAVSQYVIPSFSMADPLDPGVSWWRDTDHQNALAQHSEDEFTPGVHEVYVSSDCTVLVYASATGPNVTAVIYTNDLWLVGPGGGRVEAHNAKLAFQNYYSGFPTLNLKGIIYTDASPENYNGAAYWRSIFRTNPPAPIYASADFTQAKADLDAVSTETTARQAKALGQSLAWGPDGFLGAGSMKQYNPALPSYADPDNPVSGWVGAYYVCQSEGCGDNPPSPKLVILQSPGQDAGLMVFLPRQQIMIVGDSGSFLPDVASLYQPAVSVRERIKTLDWIISPSELNDFPCLPSLSGGCMGLYTTPDILIRGYGTTISGSDNVRTAATAQRDALQSIYDQTLAQINQGAAIDEAAAAVALSPELASSPYNQEFVATIPGIVKTVYQEKMGWFGGNITELAATLTDGQKAQILADAYGGLDPLTQAARQMELSAQDLPAAERALYLAAAAYKLAPDDFNVKQVYAQTLHKNAFMQKSAQIRNYYLSVAQGLGGAQVSDFTVTGDEDTSIPFTAEDFSSHFTGFLGSSLTMVKITSLPENGTLTLSGVAVIAPQEIAPADLGNLVFTPVANWNGSTSFTWNGLDGGAYAAADATLTLTLNPANDPPVISATPLADVSVDEDAPSATIDLLTGFTEIDGDTLAFAVDNSNPALLSASVAGSSLNLTFLADQSGQATLTVTATDAASVSVTDDFLVTANPVNDAPWANGLELKVAVDASKTIPLDYGDLETAQANLSFQITSGPSNGTLANISPILTALPCSGSLCNSSSIAIGIDELPVISYSDHDTLTKIVDLKVAHCNDAACSSPTISTIGSGEHPSLRIGTDGLPVISFGDGTNQTLKVAHCNDAACTTATITTLDPQQYSGDQSALAIGEDGLPVISYQQYYPDYDLKVAHCLDAACSSAKISIVDSAGDVGSNNSVTIGTDRMPVISYYDTTNGTLKVAHCNDAACSSATFTTLDSIGAYGSPTSIASGSDGLPVISYTDYHQGPLAEHPLKVAHCNDAACSSATLTPLDSIGWGEGASMVIGADGLPVISYQDFNGYLKVAHCMDAACSHAALTAVDASNDYVGQYPSISIGKKDGLPVISYDDRTNSNLKIAHCQNAACSSYPDLPQLTYTPAAGFLGEDSFTYTVTDPQGLSASATVNLTVLTAASLSGQVYNDANANGALDAGEAGLAGVTVQLQNPDGSLVTTTATAPDGSYSFAGLLPGTYRVRQVLPAGFLQTTPDPADFPVDLGQAVTGVDFGSVASADLKVTISAVYNAKSKIITYTLIVTNDGPADALNAVLTDILPGTVNYGSATTSQGTCSGPKTVTCNFGTLSSGSSATVILKVTRTNTKVAIDNTVTVSSSVFDIDMADNSAMVTTP